MLYIEDISPLVEESRVSSRCFSNLSHRQHLNPCLETPQMSALTHFIPAINKGLYDLVLKTELIIWILPVTAVKEQLTARERLSDSLERQLAGGKDPIGPAIG